MAAIAGRQAPAGNRCHFVLLDKDESCPTEQLTCLTLGHPNGLAYSTSELLNMPRLFVRELALIEGN